MKVWLELREDTVGGVTCTAFMVSTLVPDTRYSPTLSS